MKTATQKKQSSPHSSSSERRAVYIACRASEYSRARLMAKTLEDMGYKIVSSWHFQDDELFKQSHSEDANAKFARRDLDDIDSADIVVVLTPNNAIPISGGFHVETGYALAKGKKIYVIGHRNNIFHFLPEINYFLNDGDFLKCMKF